MPKINRPADQASIINGLQRQVRSLQTSARVTTTNTVIPALVPTNGTDAAFMADEVRLSAYDGVFRTTATRVSDSATVSFPSVTVTGSLFLVVATWQSAGYGGGGASPYKADDVTVLVELDGTTPGFTWTWESPAGSWNDYAPDSMIGGMSTTSGTHTIRMRVAATQGNPAGSIDTTFVDASIFAIPVKF